MLQNVVACILAGGKGTRLWPLTANRAKPAVPFGGSYRLIDFPLSNCVNSTLGKILVLPQYKASSLEGHLQQGWAFLCEALDDYVLFIPPQPRMGQRCYRGTADAVCQNLRTLEHMAPDYVLILASDHVYRMDYRRLLSYHQDRHADVTLATVTVPRWQACHFGIVTANGRGEVTAFHEKPTDLRSLAFGPAALLASMGIYVFSFEVLQAVLREDAEQQSGHDFGDDILPAMLGHYRMVAFPFVEGVDEEPAYWRDVGTIDAYWQAHMDLLGPQPRFHLDDPEWPLYTAQGQVPPTIVLTSSDPRAGIPGWVANSVVVKDCVLLAGRVERSILGQGVCIEAGAEITESILFNGVRIGQGARLRRAILEHGVVVPPGTCIGSQPTADEAHFSVSAGGITVVGYPPPHQPPAVAQL
jgi:glucose-1-phosphate adenylyltransferase